MKTYTHAEIQAAVDWLETSAAKDQAQADAISTTSRRFCPYPPDSVAYWRWSVRYWQAVRDDARLNDKPKDLARAEKGLRLCVPELRRQLGLRGFNVGR